MTIKKYEDVRKYQEGGQAPAAPAQPDQQMVEQLAQMAQDIIQQLGPDAAAMLAQIIMEMLQGAQEQVGKVPEEQQFMRKGGKIERVPKAKCGKKMASKKSCK